MPKKGHVCTLTDEDVANGVKLVPPPDQAGGGSPAVPAASTTAVTPAQASSGAADASAPASEKREEVRRSTPIAMPCGAAGGVHAHDTPGDPRAAAAARLTRGGGGGRVGTWARTPSSRT